MKKFSKSLLIVSILAVTTSAFSKEVVIVQKGKKFSQAKVDVAVGDVLVFKNEEADITHNVYSLSPGNEFDLQTQRPGEKTNLDTAKHKPGSMTVECAIHPEMKLEVTLK